MCIMTTLSKDEDSPMPHPLGVSLGKTWNDRANIIYYSLNKMKQDVFMKRKCPRWQQSAI